MVSVGAKGLPIIKNLTWNKLFSKSDREQAARAMVKEFETEFSLGNYNEYIPKKYQAKGQTKRR